VSDDGAHFIFGRWRQHMFLSSRDAAGFREFLSQFVGLVAEGIR
jgi:hypothetical protein